jgi:hypothetical protein
MNEMPKIPKVQMPIVSLAEQMRQLAETGKRVAASFTSIRPTR